MALSGKKVYGALKGEIDSISQKLDDAIVGIFTPGGSLEFEDLPELSADVLGFVYEITNDFTTTSDFVEGEGIDYPAGTKVAVVNRGTEQSPEYMFDVTTGAIEVDSEPTANSGNPVSSGGVYTALESKANTADLGTAASKSSTNAVTSDSTALVESGAVYTALSNKTDNTIVSDIESTTTASKAYAVDEYLMLNNNLYKVTSAISSGGTIVTSGANANVVAVKITDEIGQGGGGADLTILAPEFNTTTAYGVGEYVTYDGSLYRFTSAHSAGAWNSSQVVEIKAVGQYVTAGKKSGTTLGLYATAEGYSTTASGDYSHAEGYLTTASGNSSHAGGRYTIAQRKSQTAIGEYNVADTTGADGRVRGEYAFIIGNGTAHNERSNALAVDWDGNLEVAGNVYGTNLNTDTDIATGNPAIFNTISEQLSKQTTVNIEPIQDLHGYAKPWSGGAGKNKLNYDAWKTVPIVAGNAVWENNGVTLTATRNDCYTDYISGVFPTAAAVSVTQGQTVTLSWEEISNKHGKVCIFPNGSASEMVEVDNANVKSVSYTPTSGVTYIWFRFGVQTAGETISFKNIQIEYGSTATAYEPYTNICPISGLDSVVVERCGKNIYVGSPSFDGYNNRSSWTSETEKYNNHEVISRNSTWNRCCKQLTLEAGTYTFSVMAKASATCECQLFVANINGTQYRQIVSVGTSWQRYSYTFTLPENTVVAPGVEAREGSKTIYVSEYQLEYGSTATPYEEYNGQTITTILPTTVYGGTLDLTNGRLVVDRAYIASYNGETLPGAWISDRDVYTGSNSPTTGAQVVYELATPIITTITPSSLSLLKGLNVVSTNGDTVEVTFNQGSLATLEDVADANAFKFDKADVANMEGATASKAYYVGNYMLREDGFYRVTANIANGAAITSNNTTKATVGRELSNIWWNINSPQCSSSELTSGDVETCDLNDYISLSFVEWKTDADRMGKLVYSSHVFPVPQLRSIILDGGYIKLQFAHLELRLSRTGSDLTMQIDSSQSGDYTITVFYQYFVNP